MQVSRIQFTQPPPLTRLLIGLFAGEVRWLGCKFHLEMTGNEAQMSQDIPGCSVCLTARGCILTQNPSRWIPGLPDSARLGLLGEHLQAGLPFS